MSSLRVGPNEKLFEAVVYFFSVVYVSMKEKNNRIFHKQMDNGDT